MLELPLHFKLLSIFDSSEKSQLLQTIVIKMQKNQTSKLILISFTVLSISGTISANMAENPQQSSTPDVYIVYTEKPTTDVEPESAHLSTLSSVLGGEEAAKESLLYVYKNAATGFSAKLTPEQVSELQKQPGVLQVVPSETLQLHGGVGATNMKV